MKRVAVGDHHKVHVGRGTEIFRIATGFRCWSNHFLLTVVKGVLGDVAKIGDLEVVGKETESRNVGNLGDFAASNHRVSRG